MKKDNYRKMIPSDKSFARKTRQINRRLWKEEYSDPKYMNDSRILQRSWSRLNSSSYISDFVIGNIGNIGHVIMLFMLLVALSQLLTLSNDDISKLNPFESGISLLQSISNAGANAKFNFQNFLNSFSTITATDLEFSIFGLDITIPPFIGRGFSVIISFFAAIGGFIVFIARIIYMIVRIFLGLY